MLYFLWFIKGVILNMLFRTHTPCLTIQYCNELNSMCRTLFIFFGVITILITSTFNHCDKPISIQILYILFWQWYNCWSRILISIPWNDLTSLWPFWYDLHLHIMLLINKSMPSLILNLCAIVSYCVFIKRFKINVESTFLSKNL